MNGHKVKRLKQTAFLVISIILLIVVIILGEKRLI